MKNYLLIFTLLFFCLDVCSQIESIGPLELIPSSNDSIFLQARTDFSSTPCELLTYSVDVDDELSIIELRTCYNVGPSSSYSYCIDTFNLGVLSSSEYVLKFILTISGPSIASCDNYWAIDTSNFQINTADLIVLNNNDILLNTQIEINHYFQSEQLNIFNHTNKEVDVQIFDIIGRKVFDSSIERNSTKDIMITNLQKGTYAVVITQGNRILNTKLISK